MNTTAEIELSAEQEFVLRKVKNGQNVFFTGPAGTGKSLLLREIIKELLKDGQRSTRTAITATTGIASLNISGRTVHSYAGIGLGKESAEVLSKHIKKDRRLLLRWCSVRTWIIDEISMLDGDLFDKLEYIARDVRNDPTPFGGIQLILSGDFFQLPPVPEQSYEFRKLSTYAFEAKSWDKCIPQPVFLEEVFRQKDPVFIGILNNIRQGTVALEDVRNLRMLERPLPPTQDGLEASQLFPVRGDAEACNSEKLDALPGPRYVYHAMDSAGFDVRGVPIPHKNARELLERLIAPKVIGLKVGAQVMLIQNFIEVKSDQGIQDGDALVNGSMGKVIDFLDIHDANGKGITMTELSNRKLTERDAPYTNVRLLDDEQRLSNHMFGRKQKWPLVRFENGRQLLCAATDSTVEGYIRNIEARRIQVPLILAWAISIHKSQGQTLERVKVDLAKSFENGQAYVAISRAKSMEGLELINFHPARIQVDPRVVAWQQENRIYDDAVLDKALLDQAQNLIISSQSS